MGRLLARRTQAADFEADGTDEETALRRDLLLEFLERPAGILQDGAAPEAGNVTVIPIRLGLVVVFFTLDMHEVQLINEPTILE